MNWLTGFVVYFLIWWLVIFTTLSFGLRQKNYQSKNESEGFSGAPENIQLGRKFIATTLIAAAIWLFIYGLISSDLISFREIADTEWSEGQ